MVWRGWAWYEADGVEGVVWCGGDGMVWRGWYGVKGMVWRGYPWCGGDDMVWKVFDMYFCYMQLYVWSQFPFRLLIKSIHLCTCLVWRSCPLTVYMLQVLQAGTASGGEEAAAGRLPPTAQVLSRR